MNIWNRSNGLLLCVSYIIIKIQRNIYNGISQRSYYKIENIVLLLILYNHCFIPFHMKYKIIITNYDI